MVVIAVGGVVAAFDSDAGVLPFLPLLFPFCYIRHSCFVVSADLSLLPILLSIRWCCFSAAANPAVANHYPLLQAAGSIERATLSQ